jgi:iron-sulfur cluster repair protein YtfE (RIC family)
MRPVEPLCSWFRHLTYKCGSSETGFAPVLQSDAGNGADMSNNAVGEMALVHRVFRGEFDAIPGLIAAVPAGRTDRAKVVGRHVTFMIDGLHHHHMAEDDLVWPKLIARLPEKATELERMEIQHTGIAEAVDRVRSHLESWTQSATPAVAERLLANFNDLSVRMVEHLDDEECNVVPLIEKHLTEAEWQSTAKRGASFLSRHPRLGIVLGGLVLDYASPSERQAFLASVPVAQRKLVGLLGPRMAASYRRQLDSTSS